MGFSESKVHQEEKEEKEGEGEREKEKRKETPTITADDILALQKQTNFQAVEVSLSHTFSLSFFPLHLSFTLHC